MASTDSIDMKYRFLGDSVPGQAYKHGINFWDTAEIYTNGVSEVVTGKALQRGIDEGVWTREDIVLSTKLFHGTTNGPNARGLSRKHLVEGAKTSLARLGTSDVDVLFCHRIEPYTPMEEVVRSMNFIINQGWAFYWGTSEWHETDILEACEIADRHGLIRPIVEQPQYNLFNRSKVEVEFQSLYAKYKLGLTTWSPLAFGILTGKYADGVPDDARLATGWWKAAVGDPSERAAQVEKLRPIAQELNCSLAQLALAWIASNEKVSTVLLGAKTLEQLDENLKAWPIVAKMTPEIKAKIEEIIPFVYKKAARDGYYTVRSAFL